jgi:hypothetical protein
VIVITRNVFGNSGNTLRYPNYRNYPKFAFVFVFIHVFLVEHLKCHFIKI